MPRAQTWRDQLANATLLLRRWAPSADTFALWVSDYAKVSRALNELSAQMDHLSWMLSTDSSPQDMEHGLLSNAIDDAVHRIGELTGAIDAELRHSTTSRVQFAE
jgi:hypothetical protein